MTKFTFNKGGIDMGFESKSWVKITRVFLVSRDNGEEIIGLFKFCYLRDWTDFH